MSSSSDLKALTELSNLGDQAAAAPTELVYRACAAASNTGATRPEEARLSEAERALLATRREIFARRWDRALASLRRAAPLSPLLEGDAKFLKGIIAERGQGNRQEAARWMEESAAVFRKAGHQYRMLRAHLNALIYRRDLGEYVTGEIYALEQECVRREYFDLAASISRGRAIELATAGEFEKALAPCQRAVLHYEQDGCPEDRAVCLAILAILYLLCGKTDEARQSRNAIHLQGGRLDSYLVVIQALEEGKPPRLADTHPLAQVPWRRSVLALPKKNSQYGKIIALLRQGPQDKNQLIEAIWGPQAGGEVYENRLRVALATLRKKYALEVPFDGSKYTL